MAEFDKVWGIALTKLLQPLKKLIDQLVIIFGKGVPIDLLRIKNRLEIYFPSWFRGNGRMAKESVKDNSFSPIVLKSKERVDLGVSAKPKPKDTQPVSWNRRVQ